MAGNKRGFWFIAKSIVIGLTLIGFIGSIIYFISMIFESDPNLQNDFSLEILVYSIIACLCFTIAIVGILKMVIQLRRAGYFMFMIGLIVGDIDYIIYIIRLGEKMPGLSNNGMTFIILASIILFTYILLLIPEFKSRLYKKKDLHNNELESIEYQPVIKKKNHLVTLISKHKKIVITSVALLMVIVFFLVYLPTKCSRDRKKLEANRISDSIRVSDSIAMVNAEMQRIADSIAASQKQSNQNFSGDKADNKTFTHFKELIEAKYPGILDRFNLEFGYDSPVSQIVSGKSKDNIPYLSFFAHYEEGSIRNSGYLINTSEFSEIIKYIKKPVWDKIIFDLKKRYPTLKDFNGVIIIDEKETTSYQVLAGEISFLYNNSGEFIEAIEEGGDQ